MRIVSQEQGVWSVVPAVDRFCRDWPPDTATGMVLSLHAGNIGVLMDRLM